jgi:adenine phosphoribosyltransferase
MNPRDLIRSKIRDVPDFPKPGIMFKDITPVLQSAEALRATVDLMVEPYRDADVGLVVGVESRGFIFGPAVALALGVGFAMARKSGKLPWETKSERFELEYGTDEIEMHRDSVLPEQRVLLVDDVIATGGTAAATVRLVRAMGGDVVGSSFLLELSFLEGRKSLTDLPVHAAITF